MLALNHSFRSWKFSGGERRPAARVYRKCGVDGNLALLTGRRRTQSHGLHPEVAMRSDRVLGTIDFHTAGIGMRLLTSGDRKNTRLNSSHDQDSYAHFCL